ncbi:LptF/LptG family permease [Hyunsoonleella ulvae]|uniref:LptF/LptG family permease n=1 Tax=Hyunsoonleella ulvae TaxID=2799948 RepID=UPI001939D4CA|nr:LptF/LptG family permease [Hyunsoonleella ulvae]
MKILDRYILTTYLRTFLSVFSILLLIFVLQMIWLYIKELAGKDLDLSTIIKFIIYGLPKLIPLVLPLTILLTSIMVFGNFAENYEFAAMKSTGISLQRAMASLGVFIVSLGFVAFWFSNNVIPWGEYNFFNLRKNLAKVKPSMAIAEGQFNEIESTPYNIKVAKKSGDRGQFLEKVVIHKKGSDRKKNATTITAKTGELVSSENSNVLKLVLHDGNFYEDIFPKEIKNRKKHPFAKSSFEVYTMNIDLSNLNTVDIDDKSYSNKYSMLNISELDYTIDSLTIKHDKTMSDFGNVMYQRSSISKSVKPLQALSSPEKFTKREIENDEYTIEKNKKGIKKNTIPLDSIYAGELTDLFSNKKNSQIVTNAISAINSIDLLIKNREEPLDREIKWYNRHIISFHEKLALPFACIILFFVGAPLGALIRKGGIGLPMVIAILLFLTYHFIGIFAMNSAKNGSFNPILASWFSTLIMLPLSVFLTIRATADKGLFDFDSITVPLKKFFRIKEKDKENFKFLSSFTNDKLFDAITNYETLGYSETTRYEAIKLLNSREVSTQELQEKGIFTNNDFEISQNISKDYTDHSKFTITLYCIGIILLVLHFVFKNNKLPSLESASIQLSIISLVLFAVYYIKSVVNISTFYKHINTPKRTPNAFLLVIGIVLYMITFVFLRYKIKEDLKQNCLDSLK